MSTNQGFLTLNSPSLPQRVDLYAVPQALANAQPWLMLEKFAQSTDLPKRKGENISWKRFVPFDVDTTALVEGITPPAMNFQIENFTNTIDEYGAHTIFTNKTYDLHSDFELKALGAELGKRMGTQKELISWAEIRGGSQVIYSGAATTRATVEDVLTITQVRKATNLLSNNHGEFLTKLVGASTNVATEPVQPSFVAVGHRDLDGDLRDLDKFVESHRYGSSGAILNQYEVGSCEGIRFCLTPHLTPFFGEGSGTTTGVRSRDGADVDVYPVVVMAKDFWGTTKLVGGNAEVTIKAPEKQISDPLGQKGFAGYCFYYCATRLNERWGVRIETAASDDYAA